MIFISTGRPLVCGSEASRFVSATGKFHPAHHEQIKPGNANRLKVES
jgi:hypothetical protein